MNRSCVLASLALFAVSASFAADPEWIRPSDDTVGWQFKDAKPMKVKLGLCDDSTPYCIGYAQVAPGRTTTAVCRANADGSCPEKAVDCLSNDTTVEFTEFGLFARIPDVERPKLGCESARGWASVLFDTGQVRPGDGRKDFACRNKDSRKLRVDVNTDGAREAAELVAKPVSGKIACIDTLSCGSKTVTVVCPGVISSETGEWMCPLSDDCYRDSLIYPNGDASALPKAASAANASGARRPASKAKAPVKRKSATGR